MGRMEVTEGMRTAGARVRDPDGSWFRSMLEKLPAAAYACDAEGLITYFNPHALRLWGRAPRLNDIRDRYCGSFRLFSPDGSPIAHEQCWMALALRTDREYTEEEIVIERPDGSRLNALAYATPMHDESGRLVGATNVLVDISERRKAERAEAHLAAIVASADEAIVSKDLNGTIQSWNRGAERIFGYTAEEAIGRPVLMLIPADRKGEEAAILARMQRGEPVEHYETVRVRKDGARIAVSLTVSPVRDARGRIIGASKIARDITQQQRLQEALRQSEAKHRALFETSLDGILIANDAGDFVDVNQAFARLFKTTRERLVGTHFGDWVPPERLEQAKQHFSDLKSCGTFTGEFPLVASDGAWVELEWTARADFLPGLHLCAARDVSARKRAESSQHAEYVFRRAIEEAIPAGVTAVDSQGRQTYVNPEFCRMVGWTEDELVGALPPHRYWPPEEVDTIGQAFARILKGETSREGMKLRFARKDGSRFYARVTASPLLDAAGTTAGRLVSVYDITQQCRAEETLRESEERFRSLAEGMPHMVWETDAQGMNYYQNRVWYDYVGDGPGSSFGRDWLRYYHPDDREHLVAEWTKSLRTEGAHAYDIEARIRRHDGAYRWFRIKGAPIRDAAGAVVKWGGTCTDIDDQKRIEQALRESEERFRTLADHIAQFAWIADEKGRTFWYNRRWFDYTGTTLDEMQGWGWQKAHHPEHVQRVVEKIRRCFETGEVWEDVFPLRSRDGAYRWFLSRAIPIRDDAGRVLRWFGTNTDITEQREAEQAIERLNRDLKRRLDEMQTLFNVVPIGIAVSFDPECRHISVNPAGTRMLNAGPEDNVSKSGPDAEKLTFRLFSKGRELRPDELPMQYAARHNVEVREVEIEVLRSDGTRLDLLEFASPLRDEHGNVRGCLGVFVDITQRRQMEEDLVRAQKLESIGLLAGGIAHDFNNILTGLFGNIELAKLYAEDRGDIVEPLRHAERAFKRARDLTQQLLTFSKGGAPMRRTASISELLTESVAFALHGSNIRVELKLDPDLWSADIDVGQINQVVNNLVMNAKEAMPHGGRLRVEASNVTLGSESSLGLRAGRYLEIRIKDWGAGITPSHLTKLFDPYFTTKPHGTGLGLTSVYSIVNRHDGHISVRTKVGKGTTFAIYLPASDRQPQKDTEPARNLSGKGRVLLMDDEAAVREVGSAMLRQLGYAVEAVANGEQAVSRYRSAFTRGEPYAAVILDLTIPGGMGGKDCLARLKEIDPAVKAVVSSGYSNDPVMSDYLAHGFKGRVPKPYRLADLNEAFSRLVSG